MRTPRPKGWPRRMTDWEGMRVRTVVNLASGAQSIPVGTVAVIHTARSGITLKTEPCEHCGVAVFIRRVSPMDVERISE